MPGKGTIDLDQMTISSEGVDRKLIKCRGSERGRP